MYNYILILSLISFSFIFGKIKFLLAINIKSLVPNEGLYSTKTSFASGRSKLEWRELS